MSGNETQGFSPMNETATFPNLPLAAGLEENVSSLLECPEWSPDDYQNYKFWKFLNEGVFQVIISLFGLFGNILSIYILTR